MVGDFLQAKIQPGSTLSIVSAYFTIYAFEALKKQLKGIDSLRFLFGEPRFVKAFDPEKIDKKAFKIEDDGLLLVNRLEQKRVARECAAWINNKVQIRSVKRSNLLHGKLYHIAHNGVADAILGSSNFTVSGLGFSSTNNNIELNLEVDSNRDRRDLKMWFDELWNNTDLVEDVKDEVLLYLRQLYANHAPEFLYFKTLYHRYKRKPVPTGYTTNYILVQHQRGSTYQCTAAMERVGPTSWHERVSTWPHMTNAPQRSMLVRRLRANSSGIVKTKEFRCAIIPTRAE
jgi:hypothetical protein